MIVLGVDPGTATTGFGVVSDDAGAEANGKRAATVNGRMRLVECGVIRTRARESLAVRLHDIHSGVQELIARYRPDVLAVEDVFYARNVRTTLALGHARGVVLLAGVEAGLPIREYPPAEIKKAVVGTGAATKEQVQFMIGRLLRLKSAPQPADAADGVATAITCLLTGHLERAVARERHASRAGAAAVTRRL